MTSAELKERGYYFEMSMYGCHVFLRKPGLTEVLEQDDMDYIYTVQFGRSLPPDVAFTTAAEWCAVHYVKTKLGS